MKMYNVSSKGVLLAGAISGLLASAQAAHATVNYSDGNFGAPWTTGAQFIIGPGPASESALTVAVGGNPAAYYQQRTSFPTAAAGTRNGIASAYLYSGATGYNPAAAPIASIDFSIDAILQAGGGVTDAAPVLQQGGNFYTTALLSSPSTIWATLSTTGLTASSFGLISSDPAGTNPLGIVDFTQNPDFSVTGGLMNFGFYSGHSTSIGGNGNSISEGFDNWNLTVNTTPEPASIGLLLAGSAALLMKRRRTM